MVDRRWGIRRSLVMFLLVDVGESDDSSDCPLYCLDSSRVFWCCSCCDLTACLHEFFLEFLKVLCSFFFTHCFKGLCFFHGFPLLVVRLLLEFFVVLVACSLLFALLL